MSEICFADKGDECIALKQHDCEGCEFYKPKSVAIRELELSPLFSVTPELIELREEFAR